MAQPSISTFFIARKRGIEDDVISNKKKVICLDRTHNLSETQADSDELETVIVFPKDRNDGAKKVIQKTAVRQGVTPQRTTRSKKILHMQEVDGIETPKIVNFWKGGNLSPQKKPKGDKTLLEVPVSHPEPDTLTIPQSSGFSTPTKQIKSNDVIEKTVLISNNSMKLSEIKKKLKGSTKLAELKTSLNKLNEGFDKLDQMEAKRVARDAAREKLTGAPSTPKALKPFKSIELEIMSPTKRLSSPLKLKDSPMKNTLMGSPKLLAPKRLFSPTKQNSFETSPVKAPAYQRFQSLAEAGSLTLQLPFKYRYLLDIFKAVDAVCAMFFNRKEKITFKKMKPAVQRILRKNFHESHLAQIQKLMPKAFKFAQEKTRNFGSASKMDYYQLVITPNLENSQSDVKELTLSPQILIQRANLLTKILTDLVFDEHNKFLQTLDVPMSVTRGALKRWHPQFDLESVADIEQDMLPQPPNVEKYSSAKDILSTARNLFNCSTPMERALERFEEKKKEEKAKQEQNLKLQEAKTDATPAQGSDNANDERKKKSEITDQTSSVLKGVPKSLLDKIRAKQAAKALDTMTRRPSQERDAAKYGRLPEIARHIRNVYVTEKKGVLLLEVVLQKIENSYKGTVTLKEIEELLRMIAQLIPFWISFHEIRNAMYVKLNRTSDFTIVSEKLENIAAEKAKII